MVDKVKKLLRYEVRVICKYDNSYEKIHFVRGLAEARRLVRMFNKEFNDEYTVEYVLVS